MRLSSDSESMLARTSSVGSSAPTAPMWQATQARDSSAPLLKKLRDFFWGVEGAAALAGVDVSHMPSVSSAIVFHLR